MISYYKDLIVTNSMVYDRIINRVGSLGEKTFKVMRKKEKETS